MVRIHVQVAEEHACRLRVVAAERGVFVAAVIREVVDRYLSADRTAPARAAAIAAIGGFRSDRHQVAEAHDEDLAEAFGR